MAVCGDMLWVIEALTRWGWGDESGSGGLQIGLVSRGGTWLPLGNDCREIPRLL